MNNPFGPTQGDDPFGAPAGGLDDNPFGDHTAKMATYTEPPIPSQVGDQSNLSLVDREARLRDKEQDLKKREAQLAKRETAPGNGEKEQEKANFPPCYPMVYNDITTDIPEEQQSLLRTLFILYNTVVLGFVWNAICCLVLVAEGNGGFEAVDMLLAAAYAVFGIPGAWYLWYKRAYSAFQNDSSISFVLFFFFMACHILFSLQIAIGVPWTSSAGLMPAITGKGADMVICGLCCILWVLIFGTSVWAWRQMHFEYSIRGINGLDVIKAAAARRFGAAAAASLTKGVDGGGQYSQTPTAEV